MTEPWEPRWMLVPPTSNRAHARLHWILTRPVGSRARTACRPGQTGMVTSNGFVDEYPAHTTRCPACKERLAWFAAPAASPSEEGNGHG